MVPKLFSSGKSFAKLGAYLLHDAEKAKTTERVKWTHTLNLAHDEPASAIDEMLWTFRAAEDLKQQAGGRAGGKPLKNPVRHLSLNWHPSEQPTPDHMVETVQSFLRHMGWHEHQALIVAHDDKHPHVHVMINAVHPETGRALDAGYERRRAQKWAAKYEREHGVFCEQRLKPVMERDASPTRESWQRMKLDQDKFEDVQRSFDYFKRSDPQGQRDDEWMALKADQRAEREAYWKTAKASYREPRDQAFREVKAEFKHEWKQYFDARKAGVDAKQLTTMKADILARQNKALDERRTEAHAQTLVAGKEIYAELLRNQQRQRDELKAEQMAGRRSYDLLSKPSPASVAVEAPTPERKAVMEKYQAAFRAGATALTARTTLPGKSRLPRKTYDPVPPREGKPAAPRVGRALDGASRIGLGALGAIAKIGESLFDGFLGGGETAHPAQPEPKAESGPRNSRKEEALEANAEQRAREAAAAEEAAILASWQERRQRRRARD